MKFGALRGPDGSWIGMYSRLTAVKNFLSYTLTRLGVDHIVAIGVALPVTPVAALLGFTRLPVSYFAFLSDVTLTYLALVDVAKRQLARRPGL